MEVCSINLEVKAAATMVKLEYSDTETFCQKKPSEECSDGYHGL